MTGIHADKGPRRVIQLDALAVPAGKTAAFAVLYGGGQGNAPVTLPLAQAARKAAIAYWEHAPLPWGRVQVPDPAIQALVDSSIRNIWQAREIKQGLPAFQVGPTCYRGLWIVDGAFLLEAAAMLGAGDQARGGVAYELTHQKPDGRIQVMENYSKENGIVLWTCVRHAQLTQDKAWLESQWPKLERIAAYIQRLRQETLKNSTPLDDGLIPPGFIDGGHGGQRPAGILQRLLESDRPACLHRGRPLAGQDGDRRPMASRNTTISWPRSAKLPRATCGRTRTATPTCRS